MASADQQTLWDLPSAAPHADAGEDAAPDPAPGPPAPPVAPEPALTPEQEAAAARRRGQLLAAAGAGSGKTAVLVERYVRAVREDGLAPGRILAITFTERAAGELRARVRARLLAAGEREAARDLEGAPIGTFHGFCARLLRTHAPAAGLDPDFTILDEPGTARLQALAFRGALAGLLAGPRGAEAVEVLAAYGADRVRAMVGGVYGELRSRGALRPALPRPALPADEEAAVRACAVLGELLERFGRGYAELKRARAALDFDDLELCARELLERREGVRRAWAERLEAVMVDEFQDTNPRQLALLRLLACEHLCTVGDEWQSIYRFRHAEVELFRERRRELQRRGEVVSMVHNFRARPPLVAAVNAVFAARFGAEYTPLQAAREEGPAAGEPAIEVLLTDRGAWSERALAESPLARAVAGELPPRRCGATPKRACSPSVWPSSWPAGRRRQGTSRCCCAPAATCRCTSGRCRSAACARSRPSAPSGATSRWATCWRGCGRWPTPWTRWRCIRCSPPRSWASPPTRSRWWRSTPARRG